RSALYQHHGVWNDEATEFTFPLIRIDALYRLSLLLAAVYIVAVDQGQLKRARRYLVCAVTIARRELHLVAPHCFEERLALRIASYLKQRGDVRGGGAEQRVGDDALAAKVRVRVGQNRSWLIRQHFGDDEDAGPRREPCPVSVRLAELIWNAISAR